MNPATLELSEQRETLTELDRAEREHREAQRRWRELEKQEQELRSTGVLGSADLKGGVPRRLDTSS